MRVTCQRAQLESPKVGGIPGLLTGSPSVTRVRLCLHACIAMLGPFLARLLRSRVQVVERTPTPKCLLGRRFELILGDGLAHHKRRCRCQCEWSGVLAVQAAAANKLAQQPEGLRYAHGRRCAIVDFPGSGTVRFAALAVVCIIWMLYVEWCPT